jgi:hypothetical protein
VRCLISQHQRQFDPYLHPVSCSGVGAQPPLPTAAVGATGLLLRVVAGMRRTGPQRLMHPAFCLCTSRRGHEPNSSSCYTAVTATATRPWRQARVHPPVHAQARTSALTHSALNNDKLSRRHESLLHASTPAPAAGGRVRHNALCEALRTHAMCVPASGATPSSTPTEPLLVLVLHPPAPHKPTGNPNQQREQDVQQEIPVAANLEKDPQRWQDDSCHESVEYAEEVKKMRVLDALQGQLHRPALRPTGASVHTEQRHAALSANSPVWQGWSPRGASPCAAVRRLPTQVPLLAALSTGCCSSGRQSLEPELRPAAPLRGDPRSAACTPPIPCVMPRVLPPPRSLRCSPRCQPPVPLRKCPLGACPLACVP